MPFWSRRGKADIPDGPPPQLRDEAELRRVIQHQVERRKTVRGGISVLGVVPQLLPNETLSQPETDTVTRIIGQQLREADRVALMSDGAYVVMLSHTTDEHAHVVAQRLAVELHVRSAAIKRRKWLVGVAACPSDALSEADLIAAARTAARDAGKRNRAA